jgi:hypothetical protein
MGVPKLVVKPGEGRSVSLGGMGVVFSPDYSYPVWTLPRPPVLPNLVSWASTFGRYE